MKYPDWRAYETGELSEPERVEAEELLHRSEDARRDFGAYQEFKAALRQAAVSDQAPFERLDVLLARARRPSAILRWLVPLAAASALMTALLVWGPQWRNVPELPKPPPLTIAQRAKALKTSDPNEAYEWIGKNVGFMIPRYRLQEAAKLTGASAGDGWGAYEYEVDGQPMQLVVRPNAYDFRLPETKKVGRTTFYVGDTIGFKCPYCAYELKGGDEQTRWKLAKAAATELFGGL